jgi:hypothetical protein
MTETINAITLKDIYVGVWEGDDETPAIFLSFSMGEGFVDTLEWLDADGDLIDYADSHLVHAHRGNDLTADDIDVIRNRLQEFLSTR